LLRSVRFWLGLLVSVIFVALLFRAADPAKVAAALRGANYWWFLPALPIYLVSLWVRALRYRFLVRDLDDLSAWQLFPVLCIAFMANNLVPARAGELLRAYVMGEKFGVSKVAALGTVLVERLCDGLTLLLFLLVTVLLLGANGYVRDLAIVSFAIFVLALAVLGAILRWPGRSEATLHRLTAVLPQRLRPLARALVTSLLQGMVALRHRETVIAALFTSPIAWAMEATVFMLVGRSFGLRLNFGWFVMALAAGNLALTVPSSQGGIGPFEFFAKTVLVFAGAAQGAAAAFSLAVHALVIVPVTVLGLIFLSTYNVSLSRALKGAGAVAVEAEAETEGGDLATVNAVAASRRR